MTEGKGEGGREDAEEAVGGDEPEVEAPVAVAAAFWD